MRVVGVSDQNVLRCSVARKFFEVKQPRSQKPSQPVVVLFRGQMKRSIRRGQSLEHASFLFRQERQGGYSGVTSTSCQKG